MAIIIANIAMATGFPILNVNPTPNLFGTRILPSFLLMYITPPVRGVGL